MPKTAVLGAGIMGPGIAQIFAVHGNPVSLYDPKPEARASVRDRIINNFAPFLSLGMATPADQETCLSCLSVAENLAEACRGAEVIVEAIPENLGLKRRILEQVQQQVGPTAVICTNTSALRITDIATGLPYPGQIVGTHFWNPPQVIPCVEIIKGEQTSPLVFDYVYQLMSAVGKEPVRVIKDAPGFLGNRLQHALQREAYNVVEMGLASPEDVDKVVKYSFGLRLAIMGPLERADLGGLDLGYEIQKYLLPHLDNRTTVSPVLQAKVDSGQLGSKTGQGFYEWPPERLAGRARQRDLMLLKLIGLQAEMKEKKGSD